MSNPPPTTSRVVFADPLFVLQLLGVASMPLVNTLFFDWDAGMVAALLVAELVAMFLATPVLLAAVAVGQDAQANNRGALRWARHLAGSLPIAALYLAVGGALPLILLSVSAAEWFPWASNYGATAYGVPGPVSLLLWPFLLALAVLDLWPSYSFSIAMVVALVAGGAMRQAWRVTRGQLRPADLEEETTSRLVGLATPLLLMVGLSLAVSGWVTEKRVLTGALAGQDPLLVAMVVLVVLRAVVGYLGVQGRETARAWRAADEATRAVGDRGLLRAIVSSILGVALLVALLLGSSTPRVGVALPLDCAATWPGAFHADSRAQLSPDDPAWLADRDVACQRLSSATTLRLRAPIHPADLRWFPGVRSLELEGAAAVHLQDLARLPSLELLHVRAPEAPLDARLLVLPPSVKTLGLGAMTVQNADALWDLTGVETLMLQQATLQATARRGRTSITTLGLDAVAGDVAPFLSGGLGVSTLRLGDQAAPLDASWRLLLVSDIAGDARYDDATYCALVARMYLVQSARAQRVCGRRYGLPP